MNWAESVRTPIGPDAEEAEARSYAVHILTKVFVLIASILSVVMASLAVSFAANANVIKSEMRDAQLGQIAADGALAAGNVDSIRKVSQLEKDRSRLNLEKANLQKTINENEANISALSIDVRNAKASRDSIEGKIAQLGVTVQTQADLIKSYKDEVSRLRDDELTWRNQKLNLEAALSDSQSQLGVFAQANRSLSEQIHDIQIELAGGNARTGSGSGEPTTISGPTISGTVQEVRTEPATGDIIIRISLGTNDRVADNSRLFLNRDNVFLGNVVIFETDLEHAVGKVRNLTAGYEIQVGDQVQSSLSN